MNIVNTLGLAALALVTLTAAAPTAPRLEIKHFAFGPPTLTVPADSGCRTRMSIPRSVEAAMRCILSTSFDAEPCHG